MKISFAISVCLCAWLFVITDTADPSDDLVIKWNATFHFFDVNNDNFLNDTDITLISDAFLDSYGMTGEKANDIRLKLEDWWSTCALEGKDYPLSEQEFINGFIQTYDYDYGYFLSTADAELLRILMDICYTKIADIIDVDKDAAISKEENLNWFKSFGNYDQAKINQLFAAFNPTNGKVPIPDFVFYFVGLFFDEEDRLVYDALTSMSPKPTA